MSVLRTFTVTVANPGSGNRYYIDGVLQDTVNIAEGGTYRFDQSDSSNLGHPLRFSTTSDGTHGGGIEYTTGVTTNGTPGSAGAYTEITVAASAPTLYYYCSVHSGMGGQANTPASDTYGVLPWNTGSWSAQGDSSVQLTGLGLNISEGNIDSTISIGWGAQFWGAGAWGELSNPQVSLTGQSLTPSVTSVTATVDIDVSVNSILLNSTLGTAVGGASVDLTPSSFELNSSAGSVFGGESVVVEVTSPSDDPWGNTLVGWGNGFWGVGDGLTFIGETAAGQANANVDVTGQELQSTAESVVGGISIKVDNLTGQELNSTAGTVFGGEVVEVQVTTASAQPWGEVGFGQGQWGQSVGTDISQGGEEVVTPSIEVEVTGEELQTNIGEETVTGTANVTLTGLTLLDIQLGDEDAFTNVNVNVTGQELGPFIIGDFLAGISAEADPTGVTATISTGIMSINAWAVVDAGAEPIWTVVDIAA